MSDGGEAVGTDFLAGGGAAGELVRGTDWARTALGPAADWPQSLRTVVSLLINSRYPMFVFWGPQAVQIYNDSYAPILGDRHPWAMGRPAREIWSEIWDTIGPMVERVVEHGDSTWSDDLLLIMERNGFPEETYFTFSYSPIRDESGGIGGVFCACSETTEKVLGERRLHTLHDLATAPANARTVLDACRLAAEALAHDDADIPFALIYLTHPDDGLRLAAWSGVAPDRPFSPSVTDPQTAPWPFEEVLRTGAPAEVPLGDALEVPPSGPWAEPPETAVVLPLTDRGADGPAGVVVLGVSPRLMLDEKYQDFLGLVAGQLANLLSNARAAEEERKRAEALAELDLAKTTFFANVSHEFRTPLTLMLSPLEDMLATAERDLPAEAHALLEVVHRNGQRLLKLVNTLLDFSRIEAGRVQAAYEETDLGALTAELASVFRAAVEKAGLRLEVDCPPLDAPLYVDREMWEKVVLNLVSNAFKYTLSGSIRVSTSLEDDHAVLRVSDTGTGIPEEELPKLFQRFHRVRGAEGRTHEGSGIGLALVQELVRLHGGEVHVESALGAGSTFSVRIPVGAGHLPAEHVGRARTQVSTALGATPFVEEALRWLPEPPSDPAVTVREATAPTRAAAERHRGCVLLADDNADMRDYVARLLSPFHDVITAADGQTALRMIHERHPDLVLSDIMMPRLDGLGLLRALRADPELASTPVILLSARAGEEARVEGIEAGADDYLVKPFSARELIARVSGSLALARARAEAMTALAESEARFRNLADNAPVMVWVTEPDGTCSFLSQSWYELTGQTPETGLGLGWLDAAHPEDRDRVAEVFLRANERREPFRAEYRLRRRDGEYRWAIDAAAPRISDQGEFLGYIGSVIDITDRKRVEVALAEADQRKDEFLATLAHELRNPLAPIRSGIEILEMTTGDDPAIARPLSIMERQLDQLVRLVDDLLDVSRISRGKIELRRARVDLRHALDSALEATRDLIARSGHSLAVERPDVPVWVDGDAARLAQVFSNLLTNAATYTDRGGHIAIRMRAGHGEALVQVEDDGLGLAPGELERAFEMFGQLHGTERSRSGLGIGLSLVKSLVELHEGQISAESPGLGHGSTFSVRLRLADPPRAADGPVSEPSLTDGFDVLVVDDNEDAAVSLAMLLERMGHQVRIAHGGAAGVQLAAQTTPQVVFLDLGMPEVDGFEACRRMRALAGDSPFIVALTGWAESQLDRSPSAEGFDAHVVKPMTRRKLQQLLRGLGERAPR